MKKPAVAGIATKVKLEDNKMLIITKHVDIGYYDDERDVFIDSKEKEYKNPEEKGKTCYIDLVLLEELKQYNTDPKEYANSIKKMINYVIKVDDYYEVLPIDRNKLEEELKPYEEIEGTSPITLAESISTIYDDILDGKYTIDELEKMRETIGLLQSNLEIITEAIDEETKKTTYQYNLLN